MKLFLWMIRFQKKYFPLSFNSQDIWTYDDERKSNQLIITALHDYNLNDEVDQRNSLTFQVKLMFVEKCNAELLDFYGFIPERNPNDCLHVEPELIQGEYMFNERHIVYTMTKTEYVKLY